MKHNSHAPGFTEPAPAYGVGQVLVVTAVMLTGLLALLIIASYPVAALGVVLFAIVARQIGGTVRRLRKANGTRRARTYCVPGTSICIRT